MNQASSQVRIDAIARQCVSLRLRRLNRIVTNAYDEHLRPLGLRASQINILVAAWKMGLARPKKVCDFLNLDPSTMSRNVRRMCAKGWLEVVPAADGRLQPFRLTDDGLKLLEQSVPLWRNAQRRVTELLGPEFVAALETVARRVDEQCEPS